MEFTAKDLLDAVGPPAALIFAAWIFMSFLQQRYLTSFDNYRALVASYRDGGLSDARMSSIKKQVGLYKTRCEIMKRATNIGLVAAIFLIFALIVAAFDVMFPQVPAWKYIISVCAVAGLSLVIVGALLVIQENSMLQEALDSEVADTADK